MNKTKMARLNAASILTGAAFLSLGMLGPASRLRAQAAPQTKVLCYQCVEVFPNEFRCFFGYGPGAGTQCGEWWDGQWHCVQWGVCPGTGIVERLEQGYTVNGSTEVFVTEADATPGLLVSRASCGGPVTAVYYRNPFGELVPVPDRGTVM